jgi:hypothetical protein
MNRSQLDAWIGEMIAANREQRPLHDRLLQGATELADEVRRQWGQVADLRAKTKFLGPDGEQAWQKERRRIAGKLNAVAVGVRLIAAANEQTGHPKDAAILRNLGESAQAAVPADLRAELDAELDSEQLREVSGVPRLDPEETALGVCFATMTLTMLLVELQKEADSGAGLARAIAGIENASGRLSEVLPEDLWTWGMAEVKRRADEFMASDEFKARKKGGPATGDAER